MSNSAESRHINLKDFSFLSEIQIKEDKSEMTESEINANQNPLLSDLKALLTPEQEVIRSGILSLELVQILDRLEDMNLGDKQVQSLEYIRSWLLTYLSQTHPKKADQLTKNQRCIQKTAFLKLLKCMNVD